MVGDIRRERETTLTTGCFLHGPNLRVEFGVGEAKVGIEGDEWVVFEQDLGRGSFGGVTIVWWSVIRSCVFSRVLQEGTRKDRHDSMGGRALTS